ATSPGHGGPTIFLRARACRGILGRAMLHFPDLPEPPAVREARQYPVTAGIAILAILVSLADWVGRLRSDTARRRRVRLAGAAGLVTLALAGATVLRPYVSLMPTRAAEWDAYSGYLASVSGRNLQAAALLMSAVRLDRTDAPSWFNLGVALHRLDLDEPSRQAFERAARLRRPASGGPAGAGSRAARDLGPPAAGPAAGRAGRPRRR